VDLHKRLARTVKTKEGRDAAVSLLRRHYARAVAGTEWADLQRELRAQSQSINPDDDLSLYEVEGRAVGVVWTQDGAGHAWVWSCRGWYHAPALVNKAWLEGHPKAPRDFMVEFPGAHLEALEALAQQALGRVACNRLPVMTPPAAEIPDKDFIEAGYYVAKLCLRETSASLAEIASKIVDSLGVSLSRAAPYLAGWYNFAREELRIRYAGDSPARVEQIVQELVRRSLADAEQGLSDPFDRYLSALRQALAKFRRVKSEALARKVRFRLQRTRASGIFDRPSHRTMWDEYCLQVQHGPIELESAWAATVDPLVDYVVEQLPVAEAALLTLAQHWEYQDFSNTHADAICSESLGRVVKGALAELADEIGQDWVTG
jgi:hypothetical protein